MLSDEQKRATYDRFGHAGLGGGTDFSGVGVNDILSHFQDMFSDFFGGMGGQQAGGRRRRPERGQDVRIEVELTLEDAMRGNKREIPFRGRAPCEDCSGSGAQPGTSPTTCTACRGSGQVTAQRGFIMFSTPVRSLRWRWQFHPEPLRDLSRQRQYRARAPRDRDVPGRHRQRPAVTRSKPGHAGPRQCAAWRSVRGGTDRSRRAFRAPGRQPGHAAPHLVRDGVARRQIRDRLAG